MFMLFRIALLSLWQARRRSGILSGAIMFVTMVLVVMLGVTEGMNRSLIESSTTLMSGHLNVAGFFKVTAGQAAPVVIHAKQVAELVRKEVPEAVYIASRGRGFAKLISDQNSQLLGLAGVSIDEEAGLKRVLRMKEGTLDDLRKPNSVLLFEDQAAILEVQVGDAVTISAPTTRGTNNTIDVTVVGIARSLGMMSGFSCFINAEALQKLYQLNDDTTGALQIYLPTSNLEEIKKIRGRLQEALHTAGFEIMDEDGRAFWFKFENVQREAWTGQKLDLTTWHDEVSFASWTVDLMSALSFLLSTIFLAVIGVGIMIVMWMNIRGRTREIGTLRAIGMQRGSVLMMFLAEGFLLALFSAVAGTALGVAISTALTAARIPLPQGVQFVLLSDRLSVVPTLQWIVVASVFITVVVTAISALPAFVAARLKPVTAMQHAG